MRRALALLVGLLLGLLLGLALGATSAAATTRYVDTSCGTNGNGSTTTCGASGPWNALANMTCVGWAAGDILEIRGAVIRGASTFSQWGLPASCVGKGTLANPIIIQNYANEAPVIEGTKEHVGAGETWTQVATGVWQSNNGAAGLYSSALWPFGGWYKATSGSTEEYISIMQPKSTSTGGDGGTHTYTCDSTVTAGRMTYEGVNNRLCVHLTSGARPDQGFSFTTPIMGENVNLYNNGLIDHVWIRSNPAGGSLTVRRACNYNISWTNNVDVRIEGLTIGGVMNRCLSQVPQGGVDPIAGDIIRNNVISQCGQELMHIHDFGSFVIEGNDCTDATGLVSFPPEGFNILANFADGCTGFRIHSNGAGSPVIRGNRIRNSCGGGPYGDFGRGIDYENGTDGVLNENNYVVNDAAYGAHGLIGFSMDGDPALATTSFANNTWRNNRLNGLDIGMQLARNGHTPGGTGNVFDNNTIANWTTNGINTRQQAGTWNVAIAWTNNLFYKAAGSGAAFYDGNNYQTKSKPTAGAYYCPGCTGAGGLIDWLGQASNDQTSVAAYDASSFYGDPFIDTSGVPPSLRLTTSSGSAYNHGAARSFNDFEGDARPQDGATDIGADEKSGVISDTPTVTVTGTRTATATAPATATPLVAATPTRKHAVLYRVEPP
jgi:hypothetical protein